jgi:hypothetical protein
MRTYYLILLIKCLFPCSSLSLSSGFPVFVPLQCCGPGAFLTPGSGIRNKFFPDLGSWIQPISVEAIFGLKILKFFVN